MIRRIAIIHFRPLELYPPVMNWLNFLAGRLEEEMEVRVFTMSTKIVAPFAASSPKIKIIRPAGKKEESSLSRYRNYFTFYCATTANLIFWRPDVVMYYETLSALPAILYKKVFNPHSRLLIHYHEYMDKLEYAQGMLLDRVLNKWEKKVYPGSAWLSHTNEYRLKYFIGDNADIDIPHPCILPNFPPKSWVVSQPRAAGQPVKMISAGSLGMESMYVKEMAEWVLRQNGKVIWDIYSLRIDTTTRKYLSGLGTGLINYKGGCSYDDLPPILKNYDIGLVLYKGAGMNKNTVYAASNKVFEYLACGLDVWYSKDMTGTKPYNTSGVFPKVIPVDFSALDTLNWEETISREGLQYLSSPYICEEVLEPLWKAVSKTKN